MNSYNKWGLKNYPNKIFITENLTKYRTGHVKQLAELKYNGLLHTYWTSDGRIFIKQNTTSRKLLINNRDDILDFIHSTEHDTSTQTSTTLQHLFALNKPLTLIQFVHCTQPLLFFSRFARIISIVNNTICHVIYLKFSKYLVFFLSISIR